MDMGIDMDEKFGIEQGFGNMEDSNEAAMGTCGLRGFAD
jgi:hypothetical protein